MALELRYGREDEELMGLQFCNEMVLASETLFPRLDWSGQDLSQNFGCLLNPFKAECNNTVMHTYILFSPQIKHC